MVRHVLCLCVLVISGCLSANGTWESQRQAALALPDARQRADALATAAEAAGSVGDLDTVKKCLDDLATDPRHDEVCDRCAVQLGNAGHWFAAMEVARLCHTDEHRKSTMAKVGP
jgi:hypothetical protein